ncbi:MAG: glycosyltransferase [Acidobacteriota bacterium]|nr:glycosyltransferase [Acidobacteriota bacterium]MDH3522131.1 glycosyltransferase [Acidobacteriota bacterium]
MESTPVPLASVAVCVVTHDCEADVEPLLRSLAALEHPRLELIVVDSGSTDGTASRLRSAAIALPFVFEEAGENIGFAAGMNRALGLTAADWILALNADARPEPNFLSLLLARAARHPDLAVGAVTGRLRRPARPGEPPRLDACGMYLTMSWRHHDRGSEAIDGGAFREPGRVFGSTGAALLLRRAALDDVAVGGHIFAEEFHSYREDAELAFRLRERGWEILYEPAAGAEHRRVNTPRRRRAMPPHVNYHSLKNRYLLRAYHQGPANFVLTFLPTLLRDLAALAWVLLRERGSLAVYGWLWRHRREILARRRALRARRSAPQRDVDRWFWTRSLPL